MGGNYCPYCDAYYCMVDHEEDRVVPYRDTRSNEERLATRIVNGSPCKYCHWHDCDVDHLKALANNTCSICHCILSDYDRDYIGDPCRDCRAEKRKLEHQQVSNSPI